MNKGYYLLFIFYNCLVLTFGNNCFDCLKEGELCFNTETREPLGNCGYGLKCFKDQMTNTSVCAKYLKQGEKCSIIGDSNLCDLGLNCLKDENSEFKCLDYAFSTYLEKCKLDTDCASNNLICSHGYCRFLNLKDCFSSADCLPTDICSFETTISKCVPLKLKGGYCYASRVCFQGLQCVNGICIEKNLNKLGQFCNSDYDCDTNNNLYCSELGICQNFFKPKSTDCIYLENNYNTTQCGKYQSCGCNDKCVQTEGYPIKYSLEYELKKCSYDNECVYSDSINMFSKQSCIYKNCNQQLCNYKSSIIFDNVSDNYNCSYSKYQIDQYCNHSSLPSKHNIKIFILFSLLLSILFF
ncbi:hypothetical protein ACTFIV_008170 [Dictyostelium citrinum]